MTWPNIYDAAFTYDAEDPPAYAAAEARIDAKQLGDAAGGKQLTVRLYEVPTATSLCPYHYEYAEEWLLLLSGELQLRTPSGTETLRAGALVCFPAGPDGAHKLTNHAPAPARLLMWSPASTPEVVVYADSDKIGIYTDNERDTFRFFRKDGEVGYYDGE